MKRIAVAVLVILMAAALIITLPAFLGGVAGRTIPVGYEEEDEDTSLAGDVTSCITLDGDAINVQGSGAVVDGTTLTLAQGGTYRISGTLDDGQVIVAAADEETVRIILDGADITCSTSAPIYVVNADKTVITLAEGTVNHVSDGNTYLLEAGLDEPDAAIFSHDDLTINGEGSLTVDAHYNDGITSKDDLKITGGGITVNAVNDGIRGRDSVAIKNGSVTVYAGGDGIQSNNDEDPEKGYVSIEGGAIGITAGSDGIQAENQISISNGEITITSGGGSTTSNTRSDWGMWSMGTDADESGSAKGLKAGDIIVITGGTITIDSSDDSIHSNDAITVNGGTILLSSGDDGMHSDVILEINGGKIVITKSYEGIESSEITVNDGIISIVASDDGINTAGGNDGSAINGRPGQNTFESSGDNPLHINGGYIVVDAAGDGLDANGQVDMSGGTVIINGPTNNGNGALDYLGTFRMTGGYLLAVGSAGMAEIPSTSSPQYSVMVTYTSAQPAGTMVHIESEDGEDVLTFVPAKMYESVVLCSPALDRGKTYHIYSGGSSTGTVTDGLYSGGSYTSGNQIATFTISSTVTYAGSSATGPMGPAMPGDRFRR